MHYGLCNLGYVCHIKIYVILIYVLHIYANVVNYMLCTYDVALYYVDVIGGKRYNSDFSAAVSINDQK